MTWFRASVWLAVPLLLLPRPTRAQQPGATYEEGIFQLVVSNQPPATVLALVDTTGQVLVPLTPILDAAAIPYESDSVGIRPALIDESRTRIPAGVAFADRSVWRGADTLNAPRTEFQVRPGEVYLAPRLAGMLLDARVEVDFGALAIVVHPGSPLPADLEAEAERRRRLVRIMTDEDTLPPAPLAPTSGFGVVRASVSSASPDPADQTVVDLETGGAILGGLATASYTGGSAPIGSTDRFRGRYERFFPENDWLSFVRVGDVTAQGGFLRSVRGLTLTNRPYRRRRRFEDLVLRPETPPGWDVEVYRDGTLVGYSDDGGAAAIPVPLDYGRTDLQVRLIGPAGEVVTRRLLYNVPVEQIPAGALEYEAGGGQCTDYRCDALAFATVDYGVNRYVTTGASLDFEDDSLGSRWRPAVHAAGSYPGGWQGEARYVTNRLLSATVRYGGISSRTASLGVDVTSPQVGQATALSQASTRWDVHADYSPGSRRFAGRLGGLRSGPLDHWSASYMNVIPGGMAIAQLERYVPSDSRLSLSAYALLPRAISRGTTTGNARVTLTRQGVDGLQLGLTESVLDAIQVNVSGEWNRGAGAGINIGFSRVLRGGQGSMYYSAGQHRLPRVVARADAAVATDRFESAELVGNRGVGYAGVDVVVFHDANSDGRLDEGEEGASDVALHVAGRTVTTDSTGHARVWGVLPYEKITVSAGGAWVDPQWSALTTRVLRPVPHVFNEVRLPLTPTREFVVQIVADTTVATTAGIGYTLENLETGRTWEGLTLSDGTIYVTQLPVGSYRLSFGQAALRTLDARFEVDTPVEFDVPPAGDDFLFELPPLRLVRNTGDTP